MRREKVQKINLLSQLSLIVTAKKPNVATSLPVTSLTKKKLLQQVPSKKFLNLKLKQSPSINVVSELSNVDILTGRCMRTECAGIAIIPRAERGQPPTALTLKNCYTQGVCVKLVT